jgi:hypothetical protein
MSCGNRFQCGLTKPSRFQFKPDKPSNPELHNENQKRLNELLKAREEIDNQFTASTNESSDINNISLQIVKKTTSTSIDTQSNIFIPWSHTDNNYTPWKTPSTTEYQSKAK